MIDQQERYANDNLEIIRNKLKIVFLCYSLLNCKVKALQRFSFKGHILHLE
jgi:hypothetical protein